MGCFFMLTFKELKGLMHNHINRNMIMSKVITCLFLLLIPSFIIAQLPTPVGYWPMNGSPQSAVGALHGVVNGATQTTDRNAVASEAYDFDGGDQYISLPGTEDDLSFIHTTGVFTIAMYVRMDNLNNRNYLLSNSGTSAYKGFLFMWETYGGAHGSQQLKFHLSSPEFGTWLVNGERFSITDNGWHHVAVVGDGSNIQFYVDGLADGAPVTMGALGTGDANYETLIGGTIAGPGKTVYAGFDGAIDEMYVINQALTSQEINELKNNGFNSGGQTAPGADDVDYFEGPVSIGVPHLNNDFSLTVKKKILTEGVKVRLHDNWPDFVFANDYDLKKLSEVEAYIKKNGHLPGVPSAEQVEGEGFYLENMDATLLQKIEELMLYMIKQEKRNNEQQKLIETLMKRLEKLEKK